MVVLLVRARGAATTGALEARMTPGAATTGALEAHMTRGAATTGALVAAVRALLRRWRTLREPGTWKVKISSSELSEESSKNTSDLCNALEIRSGNNQ